MGTVTRHRSLQTLLALTAAALIAAGCGGTSDTATPPESPGATVPPSEMTDEQAPPERLVIDVTIEDGSGSINVSDVARNVTVKRDGSGSINVHNIEGSFTVQLDGSGSVRHQGVKGAIRIDD